ncbi:MAG: hypothetical protein HN348_15560, partial [Proteobacteria bacterium]|nr:hypothetical protein [Pseudomonadota bacterium]
MLGLLSLLVIAGCVKSVEPRLPVAPADRAIVLNTSEGDYYGGAALWQGFQHNWGYNHRINRVGSIIEQGVAGCPQTGNDPLCQIRWKNTGASGTGPDTAGVRTNMAILSAKNVGFASATQELTLSGKEDEPIETEAVLEIPLDGFTAAQPHHLAVMNGFDLLATESADKFITFSLHVGEVEVADGMAKVPVRASGTFSCSSPECPRDDSVDYSIQVAVLVVGSDGEAVQATTFEADHGYEWDNKNELDREITGRPLNLPKTRRARALALQGFDVTFDRELHMLQFGVDVAGDAATDLRFQNWRHKMKREVPPGSYTCYREEGEVDWKAAVVALDFDQASVVRMHHDDEIRWKGWGRDANSAEAEATGELSYAQRASYSVSNDGTADAHPLEEAGYTLEDVGESRGAFDPLVRWLKKGRQAKKLEHLCNADAGVDLDIEGETMSRLQQVMRLGQLVEELGPAALAAKAVTPEEGDEVAAHADRIVLGRNIALEDRESGGLVFIRNANKGVELWGEDWWTRDGGGLTTQLDGKLVLSDDGETLAWEGTLLQDRDGEGPQLVAGMDGTLDIEQGKDGKTLK